MLVVCKPSRVSSKAEFFKFFISRHTCTCSQNVQLRCAFTLWWNTTKKSKKYFRIYLLTKLLQKTYKNRVKRTKAVKSFKNSNMFIIFFFIIIIWHLMKRVLSLNFKCCLCSWILERHKILFLDSGQDWFLFLIILL